MSRLLKWCDVSWLGGLECPHGTPEVQADLKNNRNWKLAKEKGGGKPALKAALGVKINLQKLMRGYHSQVRQRFRGAPFRAKLFRAYDLTWHGTWPGQRQPATG